MFVQHSLVVVQLEEGCPSESLVEKHAWTVSVSFA